MLIPSLRKLYKRDLNKLKAEIGLYQKEENLWVTDKAIANSAGNLCLHLVGNLNTFIGAVLGNSGYVRNREAEFSLKNIPQQELIKQVEENNLHMVLDINGVPNAAYISDLKDHDVLVVSTR